MKLLKVLVLPFLLCLSLRVFSQEIDPQLLLKARQGSPEAMYQVALSLDKQDINRFGKEAVGWLEKASESHYSPGQALLAYHLKMGLGVGMDWKRATNMAALASSDGDGLANWLLAQMLSENEGSVIEHVRKAYRSNYPVALLYYAKLYALGSEKFGVIRDLKKSEDLLFKSSAYNIPYVEDIIISGQMKNNPDIDVHIDYLKKSVESGTPYYKSLLASCYHHGRATGKDDQKSYTLFSEAAERGDPLGIEGLADCLRIGVSVIPDQSRACQLYEKIAGSSPRAKYLLACYYNEGVGTERDESKALEFFVSSADAGFVFSQAILGIAFFTGTSPYHEKNQIEAFKYLSAALRNSNYDDLPDDIKSRVCEYAAACLRYGFGTEMNVSEADRLYEQSMGLKSGVSLSRASFGLVDVMTPEYCFGQMPVLTAADIPEDILGYVTLDYPIRKSSKEKSSLADHSASMKDNVIFADYNLKKSLLETVDKSGDEEISYEEMSAISTLDGLKLDKRIRFFDEFAYFTSIKEIPEMYFQGFSQLTTIVIPESVQEINDNAFLGCSSLSLIELPTSVANIGNWAFAYCGKLRTLICKSDVPPVVGEDFLSHTKDVVIYVPAGVISDYKKSAGWSQHSKRIKPLSSK